MNIGTIIDSANIRVMSGKKYIGEVDENFTNFVKVGDIFLTFRGIQWNV